MRAIACCPVRVDALAMYDASDAPRMESPTESKGSSIGVEEAASSEDSEADARRRRGEVTRDVGASASRGREATLRRSVNDALMALKQRKRTGRVVTRSGVSSARRFGDAGSRAFGEKEERAGGV